MGGGGGGGGGQSTLLLNLISLVLKIKSFNEREHLLEMPKFLSLLSQGAEKQSFVLGLSEYAPLLVFPCCPA